MSPTCSLSRNANKNANWQVSLMTRSTCPCISPRKQSFWPLAPLFKSRLLGHLAGSARGHVTLKLGGGREYKLRAGCIDLPDKISALALVIRPHKGNTDGAERTTGTYGQYLHQGSHGVFLPPVPPGFLC